jgi:hypothetical protein
VKTFKDIIDLTLNRIDDTQPDSQVTSIIKEALNRSYRDLSRLDKRFSRALCPVVNGMAELPDDIGDIIRITPTLTGDESRIGNAIFGKDGTMYEVIYSVVPEPLINDTDVPEINNALLYLMSTYACYEYYNYRRKTQIAQGYFQEYEMSKNDYKYGNDNTGEESVRDVYSVNGGDE